ncbi:unnamed protein product [Caenorhabditis nigoni]
MSATVARRKTKALHTNFRHPSKSSSPTDLHPATSSTDPVYSERQSVPLDPTLHQEIIHDWTEKVKAKLRSGNCTKEFLCEVRRDIGHILVLKKFDTPHERNAFIRSLVKEPSKEEELVAWLQEAEPTNPNESALEERDRVPGSAETLQLPPVKTFLKARNEPSTTSGGSSSGASSCEPSSSSQADSFGLPSTNVPSAGVFGQNLPPAPASSSASDPLTSFLTSQRGLPGFINTQTVPIPSIPELDPKPTTSSERSRPKPEGPKRKPGRPLGSTKMAMIQRKREDRKRAEESRLQAQQDIFSVPRSSEEQAQIEKEGSEIARGLLMTNLQISMNAEGQAGTEKESAIGKKVSDPETSEAQVAQPEKRVLRKRKSRAELISPIDSISDESTPSGSAENPSATIQSRPTTRQEKCSKIPRKTFEDNPSSEYLEAKRIIKALMRKDNRKASRSGKKKIQECEVPTVPIDYAKTFDEMVERVMKADIEDIVGPPAKRRRRSTTGSTAQGSGGTKNRVRKILHGADTEVAKGGESKKSGRGAKRSRKRSATTKRLTPENVVVDAGPSTVLERISGEIDDVGASDSHKIPEPDEPVASTSQQIDEGFIETVIQHTSSCQEPVAPLPMTSPQGIQVAIIGTAVMRELSQSEDAGATHAEEAAPEGIQVAASTIENLYDAPLKDAGASEVPKSSVVVKRNQLNQEEACEMAHGTTKSASALIPEDVSKNTESPEATNPSGTRAGIALKLPELVSETVPNSMSGMPSEDVIPESTPKLILDARIITLIEKIHSNQVEASETVTEDHTVEEPNIQGSNTPETASFEQPSPVREIQKTVSETGVTLDVRTSEASIPQESPVGPENLQILENQAHQDQLTDSLVEDEDPNKSDRSEALQSEVSVSLIKNSAFASTEKTMPEDPISMEALTNPEASRIISSADVGARGSEEGTGEPSARLVGQDEPSHSAEPQDPDFNFAMRREMERIEMERMYKEMRKKPLCQSFCRRPDDNFLTSETFQETAPDSESVNSSTSFLEYQIVSQANVSQPVDLSSSQDVEPFAEINGRRPEPRQELLQPELLNGMENCTESAGLTSSTTNDASLMVSPNIPTSVVPPALPEPLELFGSWSTGSAHLGLVPTTRSSVQPSQPATFPILEPALVLETRSFGDDSIAARPTGSSQITAGTLESPGNQQNDLGTVTVSASATPKLSTSMVSSSLTSCAAPAVTATDVTQVPMQAHVPVPTRTSSDLLKPTGNGIQIDVPSSNTDPAHLDSISTTASVDLSLQQVLPAPEPAPNSESRTANSTSSGAESFTALPTSSSQAARETLRLSVNQQNDHGVNVPSSAAAPEASTSTVPNSSTSNATPAVSTAAAPFASTETSSSGRQEKNREASGISSPALSVVQATSANRHPEMLPLTAGAAPSPIQSPRAPLLHQDVPALQMSPRSFAHSVAISTQLPPDATRHPPPPFTALSRAAASNLRPAHSIASIISVQVHASVPPQTHSEALEPTGNGIQVAVSSSSTYSVASGTSGLPKNQQNNLEASTMVYTAASEVPNPLVSSSSIYCAAPAVSTAVAPRASTETSSGMLPPRHSMPQTTPAIPYPGMFPLPSGMTPSGPPRAQPHHPGIPVRLVPQGPLMHHGQFIPGSNFMHHFGDPRLNPIFAQNPMNMRHPMVPPPPYTAASQAAPFNLPPVNSTVPMAYMQGHFPFPPRPEVAAQWMAAHSMPQQQNNPLVPPQKTPKRARKPRTKAAPRNDTVVSIPIAPSPPAAAPVPSIVSMIAPQPEVYENPPASSIRRVFNTMPRLEQQDSPDSSSNESMPRLEADGEEGEAGPSYQSSPEAPPPTNSRFDEDLSKMICRDEAIHEALKNAPRAKSRILPLEEITPSDEECPDLEFFKSFVDRSQSFGEMNRCTVTCAEMFSSEFTNLVEERGQQKRRFHKNEEFRKTLEGVKAVAMFEMVMQNNLITILNKWPEARQEPKFQLFLQAHEMTGHKAVFNNENEAEAEKNLVIRTLNYLSDLSREKNFGCNETIAILLYAVHKFVGCCYPVQGFRLIHQILETYIKPRDENIEFQELD